MMSGGGTRSCLIDSVGVSVNAAWSCARKLRSAYTGNCLLIRRDSDNTTQNIGFLNGVMDVAALLSFCGSGSGFVQTVYDQGLNGFDLTNATTAKQPKIVSTGNLLKDGYFSRAATMNFATNFLQTAGNVWPSSLSEFTTYTVCTAQVITTSGMWYSGGASSAVGFFLNGGTFTFEGPGALNRLGIGASPNPNGIHLWETISSTIGSIRALTQDGGIQTTSNTAYTTVNTSGSLYLGDLSAGLAPFAGNISELTLFNSGLSTAQRLVATTNINTFYGIY